MTLDEYRKSASDLYKKYNQDVYNLAMEYIMSSLDCKKGDIAENKVGVKIIIESIVITEHLGSYPSYYLNGILLKKDLTKRMDGKTYTIFPHYLKQIHKS